jgi:hypothetical protein
MGKPRCHLDRLRQQVLGLRQSAKLVLGSACQLEHQRIVGRQLNQRHGEFARLLEVLVDVGQLGFQQARLRAFGQGLLHLGDMRRAAGQVLGCDQQRDDGLVRAHQVLADLDGLAK